MPPSRARTVAEETKTEVPSNKDRAPNNHTIASRSRKHGTGTTTFAPTTKDTASVTSSTGNTIQNASVSGALSAGMVWSNESLSLLESYRVAYRLDTVSAFRSPLTAAVLTAPGIGRHSPTMTRKKQRRKINKDNLALAIRRHFNGLAVNENDVVVNFLYKIKHEGQDFRMRFAPTKQK